MESTILRNKRVIQKNGEEILDLTTASIRWSDEKGIIINSFYVGDDMSMRPDLISYVAYKTTDNFDMILKFNGISNPFAIESGDYVLIPDIGFMKESMTEPKMDSLSNLYRNQYIDEDKKQKVDSKKLDYDKLVSNLYKTTKGIEFSTVPLPPNIADEGDREGTINEDGSISLGNDVTKNK